MAALNKERDIQLLEEAYVYLTEKKYPSGCSDVRKRVIRKKSQKFVVKDGELFYKQQKKERWDACGLRGRLGILCLVVTKRFQDFNMHI